MDYSNFAAMLPEKVVFSKNDLDAQSVQKPGCQNRNLLRSDQEECKRMLSQPKRQNSNLSDLVES